MIYLYLILRLSQFRLMTIMTMTMVTTFLSRLLANHPLTAIKISYLCDVKMREAEGGH